jgi:hypothetical protein
MQALYDAVNVGTLESNVQALLIGFVSIGILFLANKLLSKAMASTRRY